MASQGVGGSPACIPRGVKRNPVDRVRGDRGSAARLETTAEDWIDLGRARYLVGSSVRVAASRRRCAQVRRRVWGTRRCRAPMVGRMWTLMIVPQAQAIRTVVLP